MKLLNKADAAINIVTESLKALVEQKHQIAAAIESKNAEIDALYNMPVSLDDYCSMLKESLREKGKNQLCSTVGKLSKKHTDGYYPDRHVWKKSSWAEMEGRNGSISGALVPLSGYTLGEQFIDRTMFDFMCFFFHDEMAAKLETFIRENMADRWGNEDYPPVAERREKVAALSTEIAELEKELAEVEKEINRIDGIVAAIPRPAAEAEEPISGTFIKDGNTLDIYVDPVTGSRTATIG